MNSLILYFLRRLIHVDLISWNLFGQESVFNLSMALKGTLKGFNSPILKVFMEGVYDEDCMLSMFHGKWPVLQKIWSYVYQYLTDSIKDTSSIKSKSRFDDNDSVSFLNLHKPTDYQCFPFVPGCAAWNAAWNNYEESLTFPKSSDININMMPFILAKSFKESQLPKELKGYWEMISLCREIMSLCGELDTEEIGKVCYLTVQESWVKKDKSQRRAGIHTERPGRVELGEGNDDNACERGLGISEIEKNAVYHHWGVGMNSYKKDRFVLKGGIFMASTVPNSCRVWNCEITDDNVIGQHGDIEHLRNLLPDSYEDMDANNLYWLSDRTPHESLSMKERKYRQYFRLVTSQVSLWFEDHSTKNPLGVVPDKTITRIVKGNKFKKGEAHIVAGNDVSYLG